MAETETPPLSGSPEDLVATYDRRLKEAAESLAALGLELSASRLAVPKRPQQAVPVLRGLLELLREKLLERVRTLDSLLGSRPGSGNDAGG
jgi:hypothetical protein